MSIGYLKVQAVTSRGFVPVEDATVTVSGTGAAAQALLNLQLTNSSGQTQPVSIDTPERSDSQSPDGAQGWTDVIVTVSHPDYDSVTVRTVQIFPGVTTLQEAVLIPRRAPLGTPAENETFDVPAQGL